jgi:ABC-type transporter Mla subunit MlaD
MRRLLSIAFVVLVCAAALVLAAAGDDSSKTREYEIVFDNAFGLVEGGDFRVGGVTAGATTKFDITRDDPPKAVVTAEISQPGFDDFRADASCTIKPQSLIGEYYVDCQPGTADEKLPTDGTGRVPVHSRRYGDQTESTIPADLVNDIMRRPYRERLRLIIADLGAAVAGRPQDIQAVLRRAHPGLRETSRVLRILGNQNRIIENFLRDSDVVVGELERNKRDVARWVTEAGDAAEISASRREALRQTFKRFPLFLDELRPTMARLGELADEQIPLLSDAQRAAPDLERFFRLLGPFAQASRPALRSLGAAAKVGTRAFEKGSNEVKELRELAVDAGPTAKPLRQFLQTMDDRKRATETPDPRAKASAPPAPDKTAIPGTGGFTGMEALWNYLFWQSLSINGFDDFGHVLRVSLSVTSCAPYFNEWQTADNKAHFDDCNQWLGPSQPGTCSKVASSFCNSGESADFTGTSPSARRVREQAGKPAKKVGERRAPGQPDAGPLPGQRDISKPQIKLPDAVQELLDQLPQLPDLKRGTDGLLPPQLAPRGEGDPGSQLLDYLLRP